MGDPNPISAQVVKDLLARFPDAATRTLASKAYKENPELWSNYDACRDAFRYYRGQSGEQHRKDLKDKSHVRETPEPADPFSKLPDGLQDVPGWGPYHMEGPAKALLLADAHVPYHHTDALKSAMRHGMEHGCDTIIWNGDTLDCFSISRWEKDPRKRNFANEIEACRAVLSAAREAYPDAKMIFKLGNHEERYQRYMQSKAPELLDVADFALDKILQFDDLGIEMVADQRPIRFGKLNIIHGHEYRFSISNPVNPARGLYLRGKVNAICGHFHQSSHHQEKNMEQKVVSCWSTGCLCDMHPEYARLNKWNLGFAIAEIDEHGDFEVENPRIIRGKVWD